LILSVERLDYTKGTLEKLEAYERLLEEHPELQGKVSLFTVCVPPAKEMTVYRKLQSQIEQAVGRINGRFASVGWTPVQFFFRSFPFEELVAYYSVADVMLITPLRDGLNLVAKEYMAAQGMTEGSGVLVLSEFAGAAAELRGAVLANPYDKHEMVNACYLALTMSRDEARSRVREAFDVISPWMVGAIGTLPDVDNAKMTLLDPDIAHINTLNPKPDYMPVAFPGFSCLAIPLGRKPRNG